MERVERIKHLNVPGFWAQGIVSVDATTPTCIASFPAGAFPPMVRSGFPAVPDSSYPCGSSPVYSGDSSWTIYSQPLTLESWNSFLPWIDCRTGAHSYALLLPAL